MLNKFVVRYYTSDLGQCRNDRSIGDVAVDGCHRDAGCIDRRDGDLIRDSQLLAGFRRRHTRVEDDCAVLCHPLGDVLEIEKRLVENYHDLRVGNVVVHLNGRIAYAGVRLEGSTRPLGSVLWHRLHVTALRKRRLCHELCRRYRALSGACVPADLD